MADAQVFANQTNQRLMNEVTQGKRSYADFCSITFDYVEFTNRPMFIGDFNDK